MLLTSSLSGRPNSAFNRQFKSRNCLTAIETLTRATDLVSFVRTSYVSEQTKKDAEQAVAERFATNGQRATLVPNSGSSVHGMASSDNFRPGHTVF